MNYTLLIPTHCVRAETGFVCPFSPSTKMIETCIESVMTNVFYDSAPIKVVIAHDYKQGMAICDDYHANLEKLCSSRGYVLQKNSISDWRTNFMKSFINNFINLYDAAESDLALFVEHDWVFKKSVDLKAIDDLFSNFSIINHLRFPWSTIDPSHHATRGKEFLSIPYDFSENRVHHGITKTEVVSNHPHIIRISAYKKWMRDILLRPSSYGPIEGAMWEKIKSMMHETNNDYDYVLDQFGYYLYGISGDKGVIDHLDSNSFR